MSVTVGTREPHQVVFSYATYAGWWCWRCSGLGGPGDGITDAECVCCRGSGEHEQVLPPPCAPPAALTGLDRRWWGIGADDEETEVPRG